MDGYQVLEALAADPRLRDLPVVMMSSVEEVDSVARCIEMGAEDYLFKPVNPVLLKARVGASLEKKRLRDQQRELFRKFATAEVAEELLTTGLALGGKHVEASVMFSDIRSFTSITEALLAGRDDRAAEQLLHAHVRRHRRPRRHRQPDARRRPDGDLRRAPAPRGPPGARGARGAGDARAGGGVQPGAGAAGAGWRSGSASASPPGR